MRLIDADVLLTDRRMRMYYHLPNGDIAVPVIDIEHAPTIEERKWIPCSERLPRQGQEVICQCRANMIRVLKLDAYGDWYQDAEHCYMSGFVIAWMPLPEPWRGEEYEI